jgi:DNA-binding MarR family transcriptional regulator
MLPVRRPRRRQRLGRRGTAEHLGRDTQKATSAQQFRAQAGQATAAGGSAAVGRRSAVVLGRWKHAGLLAALDAQTAASQQELAARLGVVPSLVVSLADQLEALGAVERVRDNRDRRRQVLTLTPTGRTLLARCAQAARELDDELTTTLTTPQRRALRQALEQIRQRLWTAPHRTAV